MTGNSRPTMRTGGRSPPFLIIGLVLGICIIGFNYFKVSSKNYDLSNEVSLLKGQIKSLTTEKLSIDQINKETMKACRDKTTDLEGALSSLNDEKKKIEDTMKERYNEISICTDGLTRCQQDAAGVQQELIHVKGELKKKTEEFIESKGLNKICDQNACSEQIGSVLNVLIKSVGRQTIMAPLQQNGFDVNKFVSVPAKEKTDEKDKTGEKKDKTAEEKEKAGVVKEKVSEVKVTDHTSNKTTEIKNSTVKQEPDNNAERAVTVKENGIAGKMLSSNLSFALGLGNTSLPNLPLSVSQFSNVKSSVGKEQEKKPNQLVNFDQKHFKEPASNQDVNQLKFNSKNEQTVENHFDQNKFKILSEKNSIQQPDSVRKMNFDDKVMVSANQFDAVKYNLANQVNLAKFENDNGREMVDKKTYNFETHGNLVEGEPDRKEQQDGINE